MGSLFIDRHFTGGRVVTHHTRISNTGLKGQPVARDEILKLRHHSLPNSIARVCALTI